MSIILPLVYPQQAILFQVDDLIALEDSSGFGDTFLDALDASYCTFEGGDDPNLDPHYPDTAQAGGAPNGTGITWPYPEQCGAYKPTNVISVSYGLGEDQFSFFYENRQCVEYLKLGLQGTTVVYASGDSGVSNRGECIIPAGDNYDGDPGAFSPSFPAACPYLTSVGATQVRTSLPQFEPGFVLFLTVCRSTLTIRLRLPSLSLTRSSGLEVVLVTTGLPQITNSPRWRSTSRIPRLPTT
jgi:tripeptidyl-peptidase I